MLYDDVDLAIVDSNDSFGVITSSSKSIFNPPNTAEKLASKSSRSTIKRKLNTYSDQKSSRSKKKGKPEIDLSENDTVLEPKNMEILSSDFKFRLAVTFQEKLSVLEDRDKHLRATIYRDASKNMNIITAGTCPDMCPEKERLLREIHCFFSVFEGQVVHDEIHVVPELLVKEYSRSSADQEEPLPHELRPEPVLVDTMSHILLNIIPKIEEPSVDVSEWYNFCWDRLRSLRKDIIQQQLCSEKIVQLLEQSARFHICCFDYLSVYDIRVFDDKINAENLVNCLQMLMTMYEDLEPYGYRCENETEFRIYMMLLLLDRGDIPDVIRWTDQRSKQMIEEAKQIFFTFKLKLYTKFFKLVRKTSYLNACILQRYFVQMKAHTLNVLVTGYTTSNQSARFPFSFARKVLEFDSDEDTANFVENYGFRMDYKKREMSGLRSSFSQPEIKPTCKSSNIILRKRSSILEAVTGISNYQSERTINRVHSSFNENNVLEKKAWDASDQKERVVQMYGNVYDAREKQRYVIEDRLENDGSSWEPELIDDVYDVEPAPTVPPHVICNNYMNFSFAKRDDPLVPVASVTLPVSTDESEPCESFSFKLPKPITSPEPVRSPPKIFTFPKPTAEIEKPTIVNPWLTKELEIIGEIEAHPEPEPVVAIGALKTPRKPEVVVEDLTSALSEFENVYWNHFGITKEDRIMAENMKVLKEHRKLRKIVKSRLKRQNARKIARLWRKKVEIRQKKRENFVGILHLSPEQYFRLWGVHRSDQSNIVKDMAETSKTVQWSSGLLVSKSMNMKYIGDKLARHVLNNLRSRTGKIQSFIYYKLLLSMPLSHDSSYRSFVSRVQEFCQVLYYEDKMNNLGDVQVTTVNASRVLTSVNVKINFEEGDAKGLSSCIIYANDHWESMEDCLERVSTICSEFRHPLHVSLLFAADCRYKSDVFSLLTTLQRENVISGWTSHKWSNFFTIPKVIMKSCSCMLIAPVFQIQNLKSFMENVGTEFFSYLCFLKNKKIGNTPNTFIKLCNTFLIRLQEVISHETADKYNLSPESLSKLVDCQDAKNNLNHDDVTSVISKYKLIGFTKWPPKSVKKLITLLTKYCKLLDDGPLLPNVIRLVNPVDDVPVEIISNKAPWLKIVELWFRHNVDKVSERENAEKIFIVSDKKGVSSLIEGIWLRNCV